MAHLKLTGVNKVYPNGVQAVFDSSIDINDGDFVIFLGPSGCGKSTTLRMIAGLEEISSGEMTLDGAFINNKPPKEREIAMVFQDYALYPNLTVYENIAFSLIIRKEDKDVIHREVMRAAEILGLLPYLKRFPRQLSGGQKQRVALGRTIVRNPKIFLMDEPMSNLDAKMRNEMRIELVRLHQKLKATTIYVTHDQTEALTMGTKIVVMSNGHIQQIATPVEIYKSPANSFVASFIGFPVISIIEGTIKEGYFVFKDDKLKIPNNRLKVLEPYENIPIMIGIRPEHFLFKSSDKRNRDGQQLKIYTDLVELTGSEFIVHLLIGDEKCTARVPAIINLESKKDMEITINMDEVHFFDKNSPTTDYEYPRRIR